MQAFNPVPTSSQNDRGSLLILSVNEHGQMNVAAMSVGKYNPQEFDALQILKSRADFFAKQGDMFNANNEIPLTYGANVLVRECNGLMEITPVYERMIPNQPPYSAAEILAGKLIMENQGVKHG